MRHLALVTLLSAAGLIACSKNPLAPTQATTTAGTAAAPAGTAAAPASPVADSAGTAAAPAAQVDPTSSDCEQIGENTGECGSQAGDAPETPGNESPETPGSESPEQQP